MHLRCTRGVRGRAQIAALVAVAAIPVVIAGCGGAGTTRTITRTVATTSTVASALVPPCPASSYGADGNLSPLFCVVVNPMAVRWYAPMGKHTFSLGPNATPQQVTHALKADLNRAGTYPIVCAVYQLAAWKNHWSFGVSPVDQLRPDLGPGWCPEPAAEFGQIG